MLKSNLQLKCPQLVDQLLALLAELYPDPKTSLVFENPFQLLVATILSAQTTDEQVNRITAKLFAAIPTAEAMAELETADLEPYLKSCGLYHHKSRYLVEASRIIVDQYKGAVPADFDKSAGCPAKSPGRLFCPGCRQRQTSTARRAGAIRPDCVRH